MALDINRPETATLITSPELLRLTVRLMFAGGNLQPLYRLDTIGARTWLVLLSHLRPEMLMAHSRYGYPGVFPSWETFDYEESLQTVETGCLLHFDLCASPYDVSVPDALPPRSEAEKWLYAQAGQDGFTIIESKMTEYSLFETGGGCFASARWSGRLRVADEALFLNTLRQGLGLHNMDYGQGLMTVSLRKTIWD